MNIELGYCKEITNLICDCPAGKFPGWCEIFLFYILFLCIFYNSYVFYNQFIVNNTERFLGSFPLCLSLFIQTESQSLSSDLNILMPLCNYKLYWDFDLFIILDSKKGTKERSGIRALTPFTIFWIPILRFNSYRLELTSSGYGHCCQTISVSSFFLAIL